VKNFRARVGAVGVVVAAVGAVAIGSVLTPAVATSTVTTDRIAGSTRYDTARQIGTFKASGSSSFAFGSASQAVLVSGDNFPDALSAAYLAGTYKSPTFLTSTNDLRAEAVQGLQDLGIKQVTIVGGPGAVSANQDAELQADGFTPTRIAGANRDDTAAKVAQSTGTPGTYRDRGLTALLAADNTDHYVDALAAGPLAWAAHLPLLLTPTDGLAPEAQAALTALHIQHVVILGGTAAVSAAAEGAVTGMGITTERLQGGTREQTAVAIANAEHDLFGFVFKHVYLAVGNTFPDALAGGPIAGLFKWPILLTATTNSLSDDTQAFLKANDGTVAAITAFGGQNAVSDAVLKQAATNSTCKGGGGATTTTGGLLGLGVGPLARSGGSNVANETATTSAATTSSTTSTTSTTVKPTTTTTTTIPDCNTTTTSTPTSTTPQSTTTTMPSSGGIP
jgi:putative cell wall-binding protein